MHICLIYFLQLTTDSECYLRCYCADYCYMYIHAPIPEARSPCQVHHCPTQTKKANDYFALYSGRSMEESWEPSCLREEEFEEFCVYIVNDRPCETVCTNRAQASLPRNLTLKPSRVKPGVSVPCEGVMCQVVCHVSCQCVVHHVSCHIVACHVSFTCT